MIAQAPLALRLGLGSYLPPTADRIHGTMKYLAALILLLIAAFPALAAIPATPVMTLYRFNGDLRRPLLLGATALPAAGPAPRPGTLTQGTVGHPLPGDP